MNFQQDSMEWCRIFDFICHFNRVRITVLEITNTNLEGMSKPDEDSRGNKERLLTK